MPDWSYHPLFRPALFRLPPEDARDVTLTTTARLAAMPFGGSILDLFGRMQPPDTVHCTAFGFDLNSPIGLGTGIDPQGVASAAFAHFGFGFVEVGPVTLNPVTSAEKIQRSATDCTLSYPDCPINQGVEKLATQLESLGKLSIPIGIRLGYQPGCDLKQATTERSTLIRQLTPFASFFVLDCQPELVDHQWSLTDWYEHLDILVQAQTNRSIPRPILINLRPDFDHAYACDLVSEALSHGISGVVIGGGIRMTSGQRMEGYPAYWQSLNLIRCLHGTFGDQVTVIGSSGIHQPQDALEFLAAGATLIQINSGFVFAGPGLPKRINEAIAYYRPCQEQPAEPAILPFYAMSWFWITLLGLVLVISGLIVGIVAVTRTVLPYDEAFVGLSRAALIAVNPRLLPFMTHDRATVAGTMISTGILYVGLALGGIRRGYRWASQTAMISTLSGFASFFLFLGFGYFDPLHAVLTTSLVILFLISRRAKMSRFAPLPANLTNNQRWLTGQWGQFLFVVIGASLILAGLTIAAVGLLHVFVPEDLRFMNTTADILNAASPHLLPLIAHDRVGFGGNLVSIGLAVLLLSLWGFRQGERWVWWTLALAGLPGFTAGLGIHVVVGYLDLGHLFPALIAIVLFVVGLAFSFQFLCYPEKRRGNNT